jgi:hypothetical protein
MPYLSEADFQVLRLPLQLPLNATVGRQAAPNARLRSQGDDRGFRGTPIDRRIERQTTDSRAVPTNMNQQTEKIRFKIQVKPH